MRSMKVFLILAVAGFLQPILGSDNAPPVFHIPSVDPNMLVDSSIWFPTLFPEDSELQKQIDSITSLLVGLGSPRSLICGLPGAKGEWTLPLQIRTTGSGELSNQLVSQIQGFELYRVDLRMKDYQFHILDLLDLFAVFPAHGYYQLIDQLDSMGTLVLSFRGTDFSRLKRLPPRINKLIVYNSMIGKEFIELISKIESLEILVLWGCYHDDRLARSEIEKRYLGYYSVDSFGDSVSKVKELTTIHCSGSLVEHLGWQKWPNLLRHRTTALCGAVLAEKIRREKTLSRLQKIQPDADLPSPAFPKLTEIEYWTNEPVDSDSVLRDVKNSYGTDQIELILHRSER